MSRKSDETWSMDGPVGSEPDGGQRPEPKQRYRKGAEFGRGGQARVLLAEDRHLGREVAWKEPLPLPPYGGATSVSQARAARFVQEARLTGLLEHPNIVPIYELGACDDGSPYYTMRVIRGEPLDAKLKVCSDLDARLDLLGAFLDICNAIAFAHSKGVIHRDLKPSNVMVGAFGETVVLDWGIAKARGRDDARGAEIAEQIKKLQHGEVDQTVAGWAVGTPSYMSPEQAAGRLEAIDERSDIWGLGAVLYELLTGRPPFEGDTPQQVVAQVSSEEVVPVMEHCPEAPPELVAVAEKALRRDPERRYQSAHELAEEVRAYMTGRRVRAYEYSSWELLRRFASRNKAAVGATVAVALAVLISLVLVASAWLEAEEARAQEYAQRTEAHFVLSQAHSQQANRLLLAHQPLASRVFAAASLLNNPANPLGPVHDPDFAARQPLAKALLMDASSRLYQAEFRAAERLEARFSSPDTATDVAFSPDGSLLAVAEYGAGFTVRELPSGRVLLRVRDRGAVTFTLRFFADGRRLVVAGEDPALRVWDVVQGEPLLEYEHPALGPTSFVALSADESLLATRSANLSDLALWSVEDGSLVRVIAGPGPRVVGAEFSPDGTEIAIATIMGPPWIASVASGETIRTLPAPADTDVLWASYAPDGASLLTAATDGAATLWDRATGEPTMRMTLEEESIYYAIFSPDGQRIATAGARGTVSIWERATGRIETSLREHGDSVLAVAFSSDGQQLASVGLDRATLLWKLRHGDGLPRWQGRTTLGRIAYNPQGGELVTAALDGQVCLWQLDGARMACQDLGGVEQKGVDFSPDGQRLALGGADGTVTILDGHSGQRLHDFQAHEPLIWGVRFSPDGSSLATGGSDHTVKLWDAEDFELLRTLEGADKHLWTLDFSPDGTLLATGGAAPLRSWDVASGQLHSKLDVTSELISGVGWIGESHRILITGRDGRLELWDADSGTLVRSYDDHPTATEGLAMHPSERIAATVDNTGTVRLWDLDRESPRLSLLRSEDATGLAFSPDGQHLALLDGDQALAYPLERIPEPRDPAEQLAEAERDASVRLVGFVLEPAEHDEDGSAPSVP